MPGIRLREGEAFEGALRRFKKQCEKGLENIEALEPSRGLEHLAIPQQKLIHSQF